MGTAVLFDQVEAERPAATIFIDERNGAEKGTEDDLGVIPEEVYLEGESLFVLKFEKACT